MRSSRELRHRIEDIDRRGYPALKGLRGSYDFGDFALSIDHVQGDPFASPSKLSAFVAHRDAGFPPGLFDAPHRRVAFEDALVRAFGAQLAHCSFKAKGSGKSGLLATSRPGPEVLERTACRVDGEGIELRFEAGLPANGRSVAGGELDAMLFDLVPRCVHAALRYQGEASKQAAGLRAVADLADDQHALRGELERRGLVAFVADGSVLPRESGVSSRPMPGATPFSSPASLRVEIDLPHRGRVAGMGVSRGVTLIVGGGYHGKSTLLKAIEAGVYDHVAGDGREYVATDATAVKLRAEDGRSVRGVDISLFIDDLPNGADTTRFSTLDASGSTSQAASAIEAVEAGCRALLIDEDTSATNFMVRDALMQEVVACDHEPITPFVERVRDLYERAGVSSVIVVGSSGAFFPVADTVIQMDRYEAFDITGRVRDVCAAHGLATTRAPGFALPSGPRRLTVSTVAGAPSRRGGRPGAGRSERVKVKTRGMDELSVGNLGADLRLVEQLVDPEQVDALAQMVRWCLERGLLGGGATVAETVAAIQREIAHGGLEAVGGAPYPACGLAMPRVQEIYACLNRLRG